MIIRTACVCIVLFFFLSIGPLVAQEARGPRIEVKEMQYDFGKVPQGTPATHIFEIRNLGNEPLIIEKVIPSCGCSVAAVSSNHLDSGTIAQIKTSVDTAGRSGPLLKYFTIYSNDRTTPVVSVALLMNIVSK